MLSNASSNATQRVRPARVVNGNPGKPPLPTQQEVADLVTRANAGDAEALSRLKCVLDQHPEIWQQMGDVAWHAQMAIVRLIANGNSLLTESLQKSLAVMRAELVEPCTTAVERLAAERILICWLHTQYVETGYASTAGKSLAEAKFIVQLRDSDQRRLDAAFKSYAEMRRLAAQLPACKKPPRIKRIRSNAQLRAYRPTG